MERDWTDFKSIKGGIEAARAAFENACETLLRTMHPDKNVQQIKVKLGDGGVDIYIGEFGCEPITVYQCKFFLDDFDEAQHAQIRNSFNTAIKSENFELKNWVLCIPKVLNTEESQWWTKWKEKQINTYKKDSQFITLMNGNELIDLMKIFQIYNLIFEIESITLTREIHKEVTKLVELFNPNKPGLPIIHWSIYIGKQKWKNTPLIIGNDIFVGSAGNKWNEGDENDGIYCINLEDGLIKWVLETNCDVNELNYFDGLIVGGCDNGTVYCVSSKTGKIKWERQLGSAIVSKIFKYAGFKEDKLIVTCSNGNIHFLDSNDGNIIETISLEAEIISDIAFEYVSNNWTLYIPTIEGFLYELIDNYGSFIINSKTQINYIDNIYDELTYSQAQLVSPPLIHDNKIYLPIVRNTYYSYPAIVCLNLESKETIWYTETPEDHKDHQNHHFGNIRTKLIFNDGQIVFTHPYSNELVGLNSLTGAIEWISSFGRPMFQQWSSPVQNKTHYFLSRYDGYLYKINKINKCREWGIYLGQVDDSGVVFDSSQDSGNENEAASWNLFKGFSLISTPTLHHDKILVGSDEGVLYCIANV